MLSARPAIQTLPSYHPPLAGRSGLRLDFNENTVGCSPAVLAELQRLTPDDLARYPERGPVEAQVADFLGIAASNLLLTNGVDEAIHLLCQTYLDPGDEALIVVPTYSMYRIYMMAAGAEVIPICADQDFRFPADSLQRAITPRTRLIAIANPNNPTGAIALPGDLLEITRSASNAAVLVDEAYFEFYGETVLPLCRELSNLFVTRTFSKAYGMAGLRAGALVGPESQMQIVRRVGSPYNVNAPALACLSAALTDRDFVLNYVNEVSETRAGIERVLGAGGIQFWPSRANFVLARVGADAAAAGAFVERLRRRGILVRDRSSDYGCQGCVRITAGPKSQADHIVSALREELSAVSVAPEVRNA